MLHRTHRTFILLHSCLTRSDKHIVTVVAQQAVVSSNQPRAPEKLETHATAIQGFWIVKPLWRLWGIFTKITEFCEQCWQQSLAQPLTMMKRCRNEQCPAPRAGKRWMVMMKELLPQRVTFPWQQGKTTVEMGCVNSPPVDVRLHPETIYHACLPQGARHGSVTWATFITDRVSTVSANSI